jgi:hypothetical protein
LKRKLFIHVQFGLTNRLRALASAYAFAHASNRELRLIWESDFHCNCYFDDLFSNDHLIVYRSLDVDLRDVEIYDCMEANGHDPMPFVEHITSEDLYIKTYNPINSSIANISIENEFLRQLKPNNTVKKLMASVDNNYSVGIHIRSQGSKDGVPWERQEGNWTREAQNELDFARAMANEGFFKSEMRRILRNNVKTKFFIASDKPTVIDQFLAEFKDNLVCLNRSSSDRSKTNIQYALADLILLSKSRLILGSYFSSFSQMASRLGGTDIRYSGFDFGSISDYTGVYEKENYSLFLTDIDTLINKLRHNRLDNIKSHDTIIKVGSDRKIGNGIRGWSGWFLRNISNFFVRRNIYFFTRRLKKLGHYMAKTGNDLMNIDRF